METAETLDRIMAIARARAHEVVRLPHDRREAYFKAYAALLLKEARGEGAQKIELLAAMIKAATRALVLEMENGDATGQKHVNAAG